MSSALIYKKPIRLPSSCMLILCSMHINCQLLDALLKNPVALKVLVWSRGWLVTLQILTSSSVSLVVETHGSSGQCVSFSLIDVGSGFTAYVVFSFILFSRLSHPDFISNFCHRFTMSLPNSPLLKVSIISLE